VAALVALLRGSQRGFWVSLADYAGMVGGVLLGAALAPSVTDLAGVTGTAARSLAAVLVLVILGSIGSTVGFWLGRAVRAGFRWLPGSRRLDALGGALFSVVALLAVAWFLGLTFARGPSTDLAHEIQRSSILRVLDTAAPRPPGFLARVERILAGVPFPQTFSGLEPVVAPAAPVVPGSVDTPGIRAARDATVKVTGRGCGGIVSGSGFPVAADQVLTNAHVVAGTHGTSVQTPAGRRLAATVVVFDSDHDVAILRVAGLGLAPLPNAGAERGTQGAVIGYPGGGPEVVLPAVVDGGVRAVGRDIYSNTHVVRQIWIVEADIHPGNSGGPLVDLDGHVIGVVFASSTSRAGQAFALTNDETSADIAQARGRTAATPIGPCVL
jgi:S1-C subfamily serine protease